MDGFGAAEINSEAGVQIVRSQKTHQGQRNQKELLLILLPYMLERRGSPPRAAGLPLAASVFTLGPAVPGIRGGSQHQFTTIRLAPGCKPQLCHFLAV